MHLKGLYVKQNHTVAKQFFEKSAEKGMAAGYNGVGVMHVSRRLASAACLAAACLAAACLAAAMAAP